VSAACESALRCCSCKPPTQRLETMGRKGRAVELRARPWKPAPASGKVQSSDLESGQKLRDFIDFTGRDNTIP
jgi:hypothetical protein